MQLIVPLLFVGVVYLMMIRPQQQRVRTHNALVAAVEVGDEIVSIGGLVGVITAIGDRDVQFEISPGVVVTLAKGAIAQKAPTASAPSEANE